MQNSHAWTRLRGGKISITGTRTSGTVGRTVSAAVDYKLAVTSPYHGPPCPTHTDRHSIRGSVWRQERAYLSWGFWHILQRLGLLSFLLHWTHTHAYILKTNKQKTASLCCGRRVKSWGNSPLHPWVTSLWPLQTITGIWCVSCSDFANIVSLNVSV